jgi:hypothetical protein
MTLRLVPVYRDRALAYVDQMHRHHGRPHGYLFAVGVADDDRLVGVAMASRPVNRHLDDRATIEVTRVATDGTPHACSMLYGACWRAARALGYTRAITYTQDDETGTSLRAAGWLLSASLAPRAGWDTPSRRRTGHGVDGVARSRWEIRSAHHAPLVLVDAGPTDDAAQPVLDISLSVTAQRGGTS